MYPRRSRRGIYCRQNGTRVISENVCLLLTESFHTDALHLLIYRRPCINSSTKSVLNKTCNSFSAPSPNSLFHITLHTVPMCIHIASKIHQRASLYLVISKLSLKVNMFRPNLDYHQGTLRDENHTATTLEFYNYSINLFDYLVLKKNH